MQTRLSDVHAGTMEGERARELIGACVHCGFCNATCPTYRLTGNELDGPRGRLYLMKQVFEGGPVSQLTRTHLDRCLVCRHCETTCPSGVQYAELLDLGRRAVRTAAPRSWTQWVTRALLRSVLTSPAFGVFCRIGRIARPVLPARLRSLLAPMPPIPAPRRRPHARRVLVPTGCVQPSLLPGIDAALQRILDRLGIAAVSPDSGCCGAVHHHTDSEDGSLVRARRNIDAWWPLVADGVEAILWTASACGLQARDYAKALADDPAYAERAARISALVTDPGEFLWRERALLLSLCEPATAEPVAFHAPCTLQHGLRQRLPVESLLASLGAALVPVANSSGCCGAAGTYAVLQRDLSKALGEAKRQDLMASAPARILSANIGCLLQLRAGAPVPVQHWLEWLAGRLKPEPSL